MGSLLGKIFVPVSAVNIGNIVYVKNTRGGTTAEEEGCISGGNFQRQCKDKSIVQ